MQNLKNKRLFVFLQITLILIVGIVSSHEAYTYQIQGVSIENKFNPQFTYDWLQNLSVQNPREVVSTIVWLAKDKERVGMNMSQVKQYAEKVFAEQHNATVWYVAEVLPFIHIMASASEIGKIAAYEFVDQININGDFVRVKVGLHVSVPTIRTNNVWSLGYNGSGVKIAIIDTGINQSHPDLDDLDDNPSTSDPKVIAERDFTGEGTTVDSDGHGTHVAGIAAGTGAASNGVYKGVAPGAWLLEARVFNSIGYIDVNWLTDAIDWAVSNDADVISFSMGVTYFDIGGNQIRTDGTYAPSPAADAAVSHGVVFVAAAGNFHATYNPQNYINAPGDAFNVITVGASDDDNTKDINDDTIPWWSSRGPTGDNRFKPDVVAPGVEIHSTSAGYSQSGIYYEDQSGTSHATPHVSGTAALILQAHPYWGPKAVKSAIMATASLNDNLAPLSRNDRGTGIVDALGALTCGLEIPVDEAEGKWTYSYGPEDQPHGAEAYPSSGAYSIYAHAVGHPNEAGAGATLKKSFVPDYNTTDPTFFFTFHDIGDLESYFPYGEANLKANLTLCHGDTTLFNELFDVHEVPPGILNTDCRHEADHTYEGQLLAGETYSIEYGFSVFAHNGIANFRYPPNFIEACQLTAIGGRVRLRNPSFEQRMQLAPGVYEVQYWSNSTHHGWRELKGDANEDGHCDWQDQLLLSLAYGSRRGDPNYDWRVDFNGDGKVDYKDLLILAQDYGQTATRVDGSYSWYITRRGEENLTSTNLTQWLCDFDVNAMKGKNVIFTFWFKPDEVYIGSYACAKIFYINEAGSELISGFEWPFITTAWKTASVTAAIPEDTMAIKVIIHCRGFNYKVKIDNTSLSILN